MELHYDITKQDYIDFNLNYYTNNAVVQRSILTTRIASAVIVALGGTALMYWLKVLSVVSVINMKRSSAQRRMLPITIFS